MRTSVKFLTFPAVIAALLICVWVCFEAGVYDAIRYRPAKYTLTEEQCKGLFNKTPKEFVANPRPWTEWGDWTGLIFCRSAKVDESGNLVFVMTKQQRESWKTSKDFQRRINNARRNPDITFSDDYTEMTVRCFQETADENIEDAAEAIMAFLAHQLLADVPPDQICVEVTLADSSTGETVYVIPFALCDTYISCNVRLFSSQKDFNL